MTTPIRPETIADQGPGAEAPAERFSPDDVVNLNKHQVGGMMHPFTCANRGDGKHRHMGGDLGALYATVRGWICPFCDYQQDWAHGFMKQSARIEADIARHGAVLADPSVSQAAAEARGYA